MKKTKTLREVESQLNRMRPKIGFYDSPNETEWREIRRFKSATNIAKRYFENIGSYLRATKPYGRHGELINTPVSREIYTGY